MGPVWFLRWFGKIKVTRKLFILVFRGHEICCAPQCFFRKKLMFVFFLHQLLFISVSDFVIFMASSKFPNFLAGCLFQLYDY
jgi:hypothetical protein